MPAAELARVTTDFQLMETFLTGLDTELLQHYVKDEKYWRDFMGGNQEESIDWENKQPWSIAASCRGSGRYRIVCQTTPKPDG